MFDLELVLGLYLFGWVIVSVGLYAAGRRSQTTAHLPGIHWG